MTFDTLMGITAIIIFSAVYLAVIVPDAVGSIDPKTVYDDSICSMCYVGVITKIVDGDTIHVAGKPVRLSLVDTPEKRDDGFQKATQHTETICPVNSHALVDLDDMQKQDKFGRQIAKVTCGDVNLNASLLESGNAVLISSFCAKSEFMYEEWTGCNNVVDNDALPLPKKINDGGNDVPKTTTTKVKNDTTNISVHVNDLDEKLVQENDYSFLNFIFLFVVLLLIVACCCIVYLRTSTTHTNKDSITFAILE